MNRIGASAVTLPVGFILSLLINRGVLHRVAKCLKISNKFADLDVWSYLFNSGIPEWVVVKDIQNDLMFEGWVEAFSETVTENELFLRDVKVYRDSTGEELYSIQGLYIARSREALTIEFPSINSTEGD